VNARDIESAAAEVEKTYQRAVRLLVAAGVVIAIAVTALPVSTGFAIALAVGALIELSIASVIWLYRRERIERLALEPSAYTIPAVARFGARVAALSERRRLAAWLDSVVHERGQPLELHLVVRAGHYAQQLESLARELAAPTARVEPAMAVACRRLLTRPVESPLYNPNLPEEDLRALLLRIRAGITSGDLTEANG
jgi:hypothetical protein